jgi:hypothetical protein
VASSLDGVTAVVLTYRRPRLAGEVVRALLATEGFAPDRIILVVNGEGGLDDAALEADVHTIRLTHNTGPAGGFRAGLEEAFSDPSTRWAYLCEDDVGLFDLPSPRVATVMGRIEARPSGPVPIGAVVAYGRCFVGRGAHTINVVPAAGSGPDLAPVDVACWGATLVSRAAFEAGVLPDASWFFGLEDFDFFCRVRQAGFDVLVDAEAARLVATQQTTAGRDQAIATQRPGDADEAWRSYYHARNSIELIRRHGRPGWYAWQVAYAARQLQTARDGAERSAIVNGLWDGARGRLGRHPRYGRRVGEFDSPSAR